jgi:hypothetical protein
MWSNGQRSTMTQVWEINNDERSVSRSCHLGQQCPVANANRVLPVRIERTVRETPHKRYLSKAMCVFFWSKGLAQERVHKVSRQYLGSEPRKSHFRKRMFPASEEPLPDQRFPLSRSKFASRAIEAIADHPMTVSLALRIPAKTTFERWNPVLWSLPWQSAPLILTPHNLWM